MKTCPICRARTFDDAEVCYGCMHRFDSEPVRRPAVEEDVWEPDEAVARPTIGDAAAGEEALGEERHPARSRPATRLDLVEAAGRAEARPVDGKEPEREGKHASPGTRRSPARARPEAGLAPQRAEQHRAKAVRFDDGAGRALPASRAAPAVPFDGAGWIVRFELPGSAASSLEPLDGGTCAHEAEDGRDAAACSLVVSICPMRAEAVPADGASARGARPAELGGMRGARPAEPGGVRAAQTLFASSEPKRRAGFAGATLVAAGEGGKS